MYTYDAEGRLIATAGYQYEYNAAGAPQTLYLHDGESGLDHFNARYYQSQTGRWLLPDWSATPVAVPYATFTNPQSLNLYTYVGNNPVNAVDADGHLDNKSSSTVGNPFVRAECGRVDVDGSVSDCGVDDGAVPDGAQESYQAYLAEVTDTRNSDANAEQQAPQQNINQAPQYSGQSWVSVAAGVQYQTTVTVNAYSGGSYVAGNTDSYLNTSVGTGQCVPFVQAASGAPRTALWAPGEQVGPNTPAGTAIASFSRDGLYHGISGTNHAAILQSVAPNGRSAVIRDQWMNRDGTPHNVSDRTIRNLGGGLGGGSNDLSAFRVIMQTAN